MNVSAEIKIVDTITDTVIKIFISRPEKDWGGLLIAKKPNTVTKKLNDKKIADRQNETIIVICVGEDLK